MNHIFRKSPGSVVSLAAVKEAVLKPEKNVAKLITSILGEPVHSLTAFERDVIRRMKEFAEQQNGEIDLEDSCVAFEAENSELRIYFFVEDNEEDAEGPEQYVNYQAVLRTVEPNEFKAGKLQSTITEALQSLK